jgi:A/G-specific adenine glycosylase
LLWRNERDPYRILVSEIMLQQTQVSRVLIKYPIFLKKFPSLKKLASARSADVIRAWEGMGYNNRVLRLQKLAVDVLQKHGGTIPTEITQLESLPGIGRYTAHAVACLAFGQHVPVVDVNVKRVLTRLFYSRYRIAPDDETMWTAAASMLPSRDAHNWNQALMDFGATICTAIRPRCADCPLVDLCPSAHRVRRRSPAAAIPEPGRDGVPNRIYRGRIVQVLRELGSGKTIGIHALGKNIRPEFIVADEPWLRSLIHGLQNDGLLQIHAGNKISLPG